MTGFTPTEGRTLLAQVATQRTHVDRDATLELGLFTDSAPGLSITEATISEPTGGDYARKTLTDASWSVVAGVTMYAAQTFTVTTTDYDQLVYGYFIASVSAGGTQRLLWVEAHSGGPHDLDVGGSPYIVTPKVTFA